MPQIVLNDEQAKVLETALQPIEVVNRKGNLLRVLPPTWTEQEIAEARLRLAEKKPGLTTAQILDHLRSLEKK